MEGSGFVRAGARWPGRQARAVGGDIDFAVALGRIRVRTREAVAVLDVTPRVEGFVRTAGIEAGWVNVQTRHTTTGICVNENEPLLLADLLAFLERLAPREAAWRHDAIHLRATGEDERPNGHAHAKALLLRTAETLNVGCGRVLLGRWQRVLLLELDGPREREISFLAMGERRR